MTFSTVFVALRNHSSLVLALEIEIDLRGAKRGCLKSALALYLLERGVCARGGGGECVCAAKAVANDI
jgi:hypothetical protein